MFANRNKTSGSEQGGDEKKEFKPFERGIGKKGHKRGHKRSSRR